MEIETAVAMGSSLQLPFELESLSKAVHYQKWVHQSVEPFLGESILEVGAGIGNMSRWLPLRKRLIVSESDPALLNVLEASQHSKAGVTVKGLDLMKDDLSFLSQDNLDTIVSYNVFEHIEDDQFVLGRLCEVLRNSRAQNTRRLITFVPAHQWAYGSMDRTFGHFRRYSSSSWRNLCKEVAPDAELTTRYFNVFGLVGWFINGRIMGSPVIGNRSIALFETLCPYLAPVDDFLHQKLRLPIGQSLLAVLEWK